jgi:hypothetical protein
MAGSVTPPEVEDDAAGERGVSVITTMAERAASISAEASAYWAAGQGA